MHTLNTVIFILCTGISSIFRRYLNYYNILWHLMYGMKQENISTGLYLFKSLNSSFYINWSITMYLNTVTVIFKRECNKNYQLNTLQPALKNKHLIQIKIYTNANHNHKNNKQHY